MRDHVVPLPGFLNGYVVVQRVLLDQDGSLSTVRFLIEGYHPELSRVSSVWFIARDTYRGREILTQCISAYLRPAAAVVEIMLPAVA